MRWRRALAHLVLESEANVAIWRRAVPFDAALGERRLARPRLGRLCHQWRLAARCGSGGLHCHELVAARAIHVAQAVHGGGEQEAQLIRIIAVRRAAVEAAHAAMLVRHVGVFEIDARLFAHGGACATVRRVDVRLGLEIVEVGELVESGELVALGEGHEEPDGLADMHNDGGDAEADHGVRVELFGQLAVLLVYDDVERVPQHCAEHDHYRRHTVDVQKRQIRDGGQHAAVNGPAECDAREHCCEK